MVSYQSAKEEIKRVADIVELIGHFVKLRKVGRNHVGLCPFHAEKAPSFTVSSERQMFHCFGCKKGGDVFAFWMGYHSCTFPEAMRDLAERYNVSIVEAPSSSEERRRKELREALFKINERAAAYFEQALSHSTKGEAGRKYLDQRLPAREIISEFRLGYAPDDWEGLTGFFRHHGVDPGLAVQAGLIIPKKKGGYYDRFRGRIIFPIFNLSRQAVGFGGRVLDDSLPKYLNTPETPIFHKGEFLYGLHASFKAIREKQRVVVVEGYMDFLALRSHGVDEVVATLGTALTGEHVRKLKGYANEAVIVFDSDEAGKTAVLKSLPLFLNEGFSARAVVLPDGYDPDSFVKANGWESFLGLIDRASPMFDFYLEQKLTQKDIDVEGKVRVLKEILPVLSELRDGTRRSLYVRRLSERIGIREESVWSEVRGFRDTISAKAFEANLKDRLTSSRAEKRFGSDLHVLNMLVHYPHSVTRLMDCEWKVLLSDPTIVEIVDTFFQKYSLEGPFPPEHLMESLESEAARKQFREALLLNPFYSDQTVELAVAEFEEKIHQIKISASIQTAKERGDIERLNQLLKLKSQRPPRF